MLIQVNFADIDKTDTIDSYVHDRVSKELAHVAGRITRVEVHLHDDNSSQKSAADDKRVKMEARPAGLQPLVVEHTGDNLQQVIADCASKLARSVKHTFDRLADR
jgi:ribosome-associated translation inhibitor RaiA